jgi:hypothetical protein
MSEKPGGNVERLVDAGLITTDELPVLYVEVLEDLDESQVDDLIKLRERLGEAEAKLKDEYGSGAATIIECFGAPL